MDCLFCKIIQGKIPSSKVYEDEDVIAFKDILPQAPVHFLFVPKNHIQSLAHITEDHLPMVSKVFGAVIKVAKQEGLDQTGFRTTINTGQNGCQTVHHLHVHLLAGTQLGGNLSGI